jgi:hypothetical protein
MAIFKSVTSNVGKFIKQISSTPKTVGSQNKPLISNVVPFSAGKSVIAKAPSLIGKAFTAIKTFTTKKTINPYAGAALKQLPKMVAGNVVKGAAYGGILGGGLLLSQAGISGKTPTSSDIKGTLTKTALVGAGTTVNPLGSLIGAVKGTGIRVTDTAKNFYNILKGQGQSIANNVTDTVRDLPISNPLSPVNFVQGDTILNYTMPDMISSFPQQPINIFTPETPQTPSFNPSFSLGGVGGGLGENLPLMMLLLAGGGGYLLGRKRKKKKKYKKRKRR